jgi:hypothetical protein
MRDPSLKKEFKGIDGTVGFVYYWESNNKQVGKGEQEIKKIIEGERIDYEIRFIKPFKGKSGSSITTTFISYNSTRVKWIFNGRNNYLMRVVDFLLNLKKVLGKDLATSLSNLKSILEN